MKLIRQPIYDRHDRPFMVIWETTQACDLACRHCRANAQPQRDPRELSLDEGRALLDQIEAFGMPRPLVILTGGDPFKRPDLFDLVAYGAARGLPIAVSPSGTPLLSATNLTRLKDAGAKAISLSVDASTAERHDDFRRVPGSFDWTLDGWRAAQEIGLKLQINTTVTRYNLYDLPNLFALVREMGAMTWSLFFLVPTGRGRAEDAISPADYEAVMNFLYDASKFIGIKTTEGHHFKRVVLQRAILEKRGLAHEDYLPLNATYHRLKAALQAIAWPEAPAATDTAPRDRIRRTPMHINAGNGFVFISHHGEVFPSGYLPMAAGNVRERSLVEIYRDSPLFHSLRDMNGLHGRCGRCEFNVICGGSRSRAYAVTGDVLGDDPFCVYEPGSFPFPDAIQTMLAEVG